MKGLLRPKRIVALGGIAGAVAFWQIRSRRRRQEELEWEAEVVGAIDEGRRSGESAGSLSESTSGSTS